MRSKLVGRLILPLLFLLVIAAPAGAQDALKVVIGNMINWENQAPQLGQDVGIFRKHGLVLSNVGVQGTGETVQAVISGSADIGAAVGTVAALRAYTRGAPVRILSPMFTGIDDVYWYVRADSPIKSLKDATEKMTIAYSSSGSTTDLVVTGFVQELGIKARPIKTGGIPATFTQVMSGQVDIGWAAPPFGLQEVKDGKIRIVARGSDVPSLRGQTIRVLIVNANSLRDKKDAITRFMKAYRESVDWMYSDPKAVAMYAEKMKTSEAIVRDAMAAFHPKSALQTDSLSDVDGIMRDAVKLGFIEKPLTKEQLGDLVQNPLHP